MFTNYLNNSSQTKTCQDIRQYTVKRQDVKSCEKIQPPKQGLLWVLLDVNETIMLDESINKSEGLVTTYLATSISLIT